MTKNKYYIFNIDIKTLNIGNTILLIGLMLISYFLYPTYLKDVFYNYNFLAFFTYYLLYMFIHELIHSISYILNGANLKNIYYGIVLEKSILCCLCKQNITRKNILISLLSPLITIGIITYFIALIYKLPLLFILSIFNIAGSIGDLIMFKFINNLSKDIEFSEFDDPIGFAIYTKDKLDKQKDLGINYIKTTNTLKRTKTSKVFISRPSIIIILLFIIFGLLLKTT